MACMSPTLPSKPGLAPAAVCLALALVLAATTIYQRSHIAGLRSELEETAGNLEDVRAERDILSTEVDELEQALTEAEKAAEAAEALPSERAGEAAGSRPAGMSRAEAENRVTDALMDGGATLIRELTGLEGVLGGTMGFYTEDNITVLNDRWVHAWFEDGHIGGEMLLLYTFDDDGDLSFTLLDLAQH